MPYDFRGKPFEQKFFDTIFGIKKNHELVDYFAQHVYAAPSEFKTDQLNERNIALHKNIQKRQEDFFAKNTVFTQIFIVNTQLLFLGQPDEIRKIILERRLNDLYLFLSLRFVLFEDSRNLQRRELFDHIVNLVKESITWEFNEDVIKNHLINYCVFNALKHKILPTLYVEFQRKKIEKELNECEFSEQISINQESWLEIETKAKQKYLSMTQQTLPWMPILTTTGIFLTTCVLSSSVLLGTLAGITSGGIAFITSGKREHQINSKTEQWLINQAIKNHYSISLSLDQLNQLKEKKVLDKLDIKIKNLLFKEILDQMLIKNLETISLQKKVTYKDGQNHTIYARADIIEAAEQPAVTSSIVKPSSSSSYNYLRELGYSSKEIEQLRSDTGFNENAELLTPETSTKDETYQWHEALTTEMDTILPLHTPGGGQQFIGLAVNTLRQQMEEQGIDNPDELLQTFIEEWHRVAEGKTECFKKLTHIESKRPIDFNKNEEEVGKFEWELTIKKAGGEGAARIYFHTVMDATGKATLHYGCWFDAKGLHSNRSKREFKNKTTPLKIENNDLCENALELYEHDKKELTPRR